MFGPALFVLGPGLASVFPDGRLLSGWWARAVWLCATAIVVGAVLAAVAPGQLEETIASRTRWGSAGLPADLRAVGNTLTTMALVVGAVVAAASLVAPIPTIVHRGPAPAEVVPVRRRRTGPW